MKFSDTVSGVLALVLGTAVAFHTRTFPPMPGQPVGPALFPAAIGTGLIVAGAALILADVRRRPSSLVVVEAWARRPRMVVNFALVFAVLLFYALVLHRLGFFITALLFLIVLFVAFGVNRTWILPVSIVVVLLIHYAFYTLLRVPLPWGVLEGLAW
jgi:putative tricarboxylic transport membrane protein